MKQNGWIAKFTREFLEKPGEHLIEVGITGSGKTQGMYWILEGLLHNSDETIVWFDTGKSSEMLTLAKMKHLHVFIPKGTAIELTGENADIIYTEFINPQTIWTSLKKDRINVVCLEPFILDPVTYTKIIMGLFMELIKLAHNYQVPVPMAIFIDEFHRIAPSKGNVLNFKQMAMGAVIQHNLERLRSLHIRFIGTTHGWMKTRAGVRNSFNWIMARRGSHFSADQPKLNRFNPLFEKLGTDEGIICFPVKIFTDIIHFPLYEVGEDLGRIRYKGIYEIEVHKHKPIDIEKGI